MFSTPSAHYWDKCNSVGLVLCRNHWARCCSFLGEGWVSWRNRKTYIFPFSSSSWLKEMMFLRAELPKISVLSIRFWLKVAFLILHPEKLGLFFFFAWINQDSERVVKGCSVCKDKVPVFQTGSICHRNYCQHHFNLVLPNLKIWLSCLEKI